MKKRSRYTLTGQMVRFGSRHKASIFKDTIDFLDVDASIFDTQIYADN